MTNFCNHLKRTYLFFDTSHLVENIRYNLLNSMKLMFVAFEFSDFNIQCPEGYITWGVYIRYAILTQT